MHIDEQESVPAARTTIKQQAFLKSEAALDAQSQLKLMVNDPLYNTQDTFSSSKTPNTSFVEKHMRYLSEHPNLRIRDYLANLRLKTKIRR